MKTLKNICILIALCCIAVNLNAAQVLSYDFGYKNTPYTTWDYEDVSANSHNGTEGGSWYHADGRTDTNADLWDDVGGDRGGIYASRTDYEIAYDIANGGNPDNQRVFMDSRPAIAAGGGITFALWVNPETTHSRSATNADPDFAHLIALGAYGDNPIATIELDSNKRVHGWIEGNGSDTQYEITGTASIAANTWTHIAITYDRVNNVATTYINGVFDRSMAIAGVGDGILDFAAGGMYGQLGGGIITHHTSTFVGMMDNVMIYDEVLSESQILELLNSTPTEPEIAHTPDPQDEENFVEIDTDLIWQAPGAYTASGYHIYFDTNDLKVQNATPASTDLLHKVLNHTSTTLVLGVELNYSTTYYWRVDALDAGVPQEGDVWEFTTKANPFALGDIDKNGTVDLADLTVLSEQWLNTGSGWSADINGSLKVDLVDFAAVASDWDFFTAKDYFDESSSLANWLIVDEGGIDSPSNWSVVSGELMESSNIYGPDQFATDNRKGSYACWNAPQSLLWADYQFNVSLRSSDNDGIGVMFRYQDAGNYYKFDMDSQRVFRKLFKIYNGVETTIATASAGYTAGEQMNLSVDVTGDQINVLVGGVNVFGSAVIDADIAYGTVALYNWGNQASYFDDFSVQVASSFNVVANNDSYEMDQNTTLSVTTGGVLDNDTAASGSLSAALVTDVQHGNLTLNSDGTFAYTPDPNYSGVDSFVYEAVSDVQGFDQAAVSIRVHSDSEFSIVLLPDTQNYSDYAPAVYNSQTQWIADNKDELNIAFVLHEGDFTNYNLIREWDNADYAMDILDAAGVSYAAATGNHDTGPGGNASTRDVGYFNSYFPVARFTNLQGVYETGHAENSYHYFTAGGIDWLALSLEFGPRTAVLAWANQVIAAHPNRRVMVVTHAYMYSDDTRIGSGDTWNPHTYTVCTTATGDQVCNDGEEMWTNFIKLHENISFVFSGHILNDGVGTLVSTGDNGNLVYQMLANYQFEANGGNGWLRILTFCPEMQKVFVETYSPYLDQYKTGPDQQFELNNVDLTTP